jgi:hypothetical protein
MTPPQFEKVDETYEFGGVVLCAEILDTTVLFEDAAPG